MRWPWTKRPQPIDVASIVAFIQAGGRPSLAEWASFDATTRKAFVIAAERVYLERARQALRIALHGDEALVEELGATDDGATERLAVAQKWAESLRAGAA